MEIEAKNTFLDIINSADKPVLVDFWAPWCMPCKQVAPMIDEVANDYRDRIEITKINVEEHPEIASSYQVLGLPTLMMFKAGQPVDALVGGISKASLVNLINNTVKA